MIGGTTIHLDPVRVAQAACLIKGSDRELSDAFVTKLTESWMRKDVGILGAYPQVPLCGSHSVCLVPARRSRGYLQPFQEAVLALSSGNNMLEEIDPELALNMTVCVVRLEGACASDKAVVCGSAAPTQ